VSIVTTDTANYITTPNGSGTKNISSLVPGNNYDSAVFLVWVKGNPWADWGYWYQKLDTYAGGGVGIQLRTAGTNLWDTRWDRNTTDMIIRDAGEIQPNASGKWVCIVNHYNWVADPYEVRYYYYSKVNGWSETSSIISAQGAGGFVDDTAGAVARIGWNWSGKMSRIGIGGMYTPGGIIPKPTEKPDIYRPFLQGSYSKAAGLGMKRWHRFDQLDHTCPFSGEQCTWVGARYIDGDEPDFPISTARRPHAAKRHHRI